ncbi:MAG: hypothetical protein ED556_11985 [Winogradskyella sp.]|nr:MAG: hypothetical protein ED556_11985 [Winogradskyella sp.]
MLALICLNKTIAQIEDFETIDFKKADSIATLYKGNSLDNLPELVFNLTNELETDVERFRAIYYWVCTNVKNDYSLYAKNKRKRKKLRLDSLKLEQWNEKFKKKIFATLLKKKRTICSGYAFIVKSLCDIANIKCTIVDGWGKTSTTEEDELIDPNHSWIAVNLENKWYLCDPTWAAGSQNSKNGRFKFNYNDGFFLAPPKLFFVNHFPLYKNWFLNVENEKTFQKFMEAPIIYNATYNKLNSCDSPNKLYNLIHKNYTVNLKYSLKHNINIRQIKLVLDNGTESKTVRPDKISLDNKNLIVFYLMKKTGVYDLHLKIDDKYIASYTYEVIPKPKHQNSPNQ